MLKYLRGEGKRPTGEVFLRIQERTGVDLNWLLNDSDTREGPVYLEKESDKPHGGVYGIIRIGETADANEYPIVSYAAAETDGHAVEFAEPAEDPLTIPAGTSAAVIRGGSMEPLAMDGQTVFLAPESREPRNGDLVVVWAGNGEGRTYYKRWGGWHGNHLMLLSVNPLEASSPVIEIGNHEFLHARVVVGVWYG